MTARTVAHAPRAVVLALPPRARRRLLVALALATALAAGYLGWLRDSSLVAVERVEVSGLTAPSAPRIEQALASAATDMTTLHVRRDVLERAVAGFPVVRGLQVEPDFPHGLRINVIEHRPVALLSSGGRQIPVAGDGTLLPDVEVGGMLPAIRAAGGLGDGRLSGDAAAALVGIAGAAPGPLRARAERVAQVPGRGVVVTLRDGPELIFGAPTAIRAKWAAAVAVLADAASSGASYVDLRIPSRPAAGGVGAQTIDPVQPAGGDAVAPSAPSAPEQAAAAPQQAAPEPAAPAPQAGGGTAPPQADAQAQVEAPGDG